MFLEDFTAWLKARPGVSALTTRVYPEVLPQNATYPAITYGLENVDRPMSFDGQGTFVGADLRIDCWGDTYAAAKELSEAVKDALRNYSGAMGSTTVNQVILEGELDVYEQAVEKFRSSRNVTVWYYE